MASTTKNYILQTPRLGLRNWLPSDLAPFSDMTADPRVMRYFPNTIDENQTRYLIEKFEKHSAEHGYCFYAVDRLDTDTFIGFIGLNRVHFVLLDFTPCTEIGWRLHPDAWGQGFATEGAQACLEHAFTKLGLDMVYSFTPHPNRPSERVMQRLGMQADGDFIHPMMEPTHELQPVLLYKISAADWQKNKLK